MFFGYENKEEYSLYVPKNTFKRNVDLLLTEEEDKKQYVFIKDIHTFRYDHRLHVEEKICRYYLQAFITAEILKVMI